MLTSTTCFDYLMIVDTEVLYSILRVMNECYTATPIILPKIPSHPVLDAGTYHGATPPFSRYILIVYTHPFLYSKS